MLINNDLINQWEPKVQKISSTTFIKGMDRDEFLKKREKFSIIVHDLVVSMKGSISAEHGIGLSRRDELMRYKSKIEIELMRQIKIAIDPKNQMNPNKVVPFDLT